MRKFYLSVPPALLLVSIARADTISVYASQAAFNAASITTSYNIPAPANGGTVQHLGNYATTIGPVTFNQGGTGNFILQNNGLYGAGQTYLERGGTGAYETLTLKGATAVGVEIASFEYAATLTFDVNGTVFSFPTQAGKPGVGAPIFVGFTSATPITSIQIKDTAPETDILKFQVGSAATVTSVAPEPSSIALLGTGLLGVAGLVRRRYA